MNIKPLTPDFAGDVTGIDLTRPRTVAQVSAIEAGMDRYAVLVFHDQHFDDDTQLAFSRNFGELEVSSGAEMSKPEERRLKMEMADISNLDQAQPLASGGRPQAAGCVGQPAVALRRIVPGGTGEILVAVGARGAGQGREYRVRRYAGGLRRVGRCDEGRDR